MPNTFTDADRALNNCLSDSAFLREAMPLYIAVFHHKHSQNGLVQALCLQPRRDGAMGS